MTTATAPEMLGRDPRTRILIDAVEAAGWTYDARTDDWHTADESCWLTVVAGQGGEDPRPFYGARGQLPGNENGSLYSYDPRRVMDVLAAAGVIPAPQPVYAEDLAKLFTREAEQIVQETGRYVPTPVTALMVYDAQQKSRAGTRSVHNPMPEAQYVGHRTRGARPFWHVMDVPALIDWYHNRPGRGAHPRKAAPVVAEPQELRADTTVPAWSGKPTRRTARGHGIRKGELFLWFSFGDEQPYDEPCPAVIESYADGFFTLAYVFGDKVLRIRFSNARKFWAMKIQEEGK